MMRWCRHRFLRFQDLSKSNPPLNFDSKHEMLAKKKSPLRGEIIIFKMLLTGTALNRNSTLYIFVILSPTLNRGPAVITSLKDFLLCVIQCEAWEDPAMLGRLVNLK